MPSSARGGVDGDGGAEAAEVSVRCARKWVGRYRADGELGLLDRASAPGSIRTARPRTGAGDRGAEAVAVHWPEIAEVLGIAVSTVSGILTRIGMGKLGRVGWSRRSATSELVLVS